MTLKQYAIFGFVILITFLCFLPDIQNEFLMWDDVGCIIENKNIQTFNMNTILWSFTSFFHTIWTPLTWISLAIDYSLWGSNPTGYHIVNNTLHALNAGLFFLIAVQLFSTYECHIKGGNRQASDRILYCALFSALFFALHPLRVESVAWIIERKDTLSSFFGLSSVIAYICYVNKQEQINSPHTNRCAIPGIHSTSYWLSVSMLCLSVLTKATLVTAPCILLLLDWFPFQRHRKTRPISLFIEKIPFFIPALCTALVTMSAHKPVDGVTGHLNILSRFVIACNSVITYLWLTIWPTNLSPFYPVPDSAADLVGFQYGFSVVLVLLFTILAIITARQYPAIAATWLYYILTLLPTLGFIVKTYGATSMAARFTYIPSLGLSLLAGAGMLLLVNSFGSLRLPSAVMVIVFTSIVMFYGSVTLSHIPFWKDNYSFWTRANKVLSNMNPQPANNWLTHSNLATALIYKGKSDEALYHILEALRIKPNDADSLINLGILYNMSRQPQNAIDSFQRALQASPNQSEALSQLCVTYCSAGLQRDSRETFLLLQSVNPDKAANLSGVLRSSGCI